MPSAAVYIWKSFARQAGTVGECTPTLLPAEEVYGTDEGAELDTATLATAELPPLPDEPAGAAAGTRPQSIQKADCTRFGYAVY